MSLKPIETVYKGYRFRSRLEARWAVFFDALGITWEYEKEGYDLGKLGKYLPDFVLPGLGMVVDIKPAELNREQLSNACDKVCEVAYGLGHIGAVIRGQPSEEKITLTCWDMTDSSGGQYCWEQNHEWFYWFIDDDGLVRCWFDSEGNGRRTIHSDPMMMGSMSVGAYKKLDMTDKYRGDLIIACAYGMAKSARFEYGETPRVVSLRGLLGPSRVDSLFICEGEINASAIREVKKGVCDALSVGEGEMVFPLPQQVVDLAKQYKHVVAWANKEETARSAALALGSAAYRSGEIDGHLADPNRMQQIGLLSGMIEVMLQRIESKK